MTRAGGLVLLVVALVAVALLWPRSQALVVYCAHDAVYSEAVLRRFERETGIPVEIRFDTEATKSLSLVNRILSEKSNPQCDVFWNNEQLGTMALAEADCLEPYRGPGNERVPSKFKDEQARWTGFAARFRVWIVNRDRIPENPSTLATRLDSQVFPLPSSPSPSLSRMAVAIPLYGTTLTHYSALWNGMGRDDLQRWHRGALDRGLKLVPGNGRVMGLVAGGVCDFGWTDTDDFFTARDEGKPVVCFPVLVGGRAIAIPNTVAIVRGTKRREWSRRLVEFLLAESNQLDLASSRSRQLPLGPVDPQALPPEVRELLPWLNGALDLRTLLPARNACLEWLQQESPP